MDLDQRIHQKVAESFGNNPPAAIESTVRNILSDKIASPVFAVYNDLFNAVSSGTDRDEILKIFNEYPSEMILEMYDKAVADLKDIDNNPNFIDDEVTPISDESPNSSSTASKESVMSTPVQNLVGARIIEQLAGTGKATLGYVANNMKEDPVLVGQIAQGLLRGGLVVQSGQTYQVSNAINAQLSELVTEDGLSLLQASQVVKEATDSPGEGVETADSVHDTIPTTPNIPNDPETSQPVNNGPVGLDGNAIDTAPSVQQTIQQDPTTVNKPNATDPAPTGTATNSDIGSDQIKTAPTVHDTVPVPSAKDGVPPGEKNADLPGAGQNQ